MSYRQKTHENKKGVAAFFISFSLHLLLAFALFFTDTKMIKKAEEISVDIVTPHDIKSNSLNDAMVPQQKRRRMESAQKTLRMEKSQATDAQKNKSMEAPVQSEVAIGESDIESSLSGRSPVNEAERYLAYIRDQIARQQTYPIPSRSFHEEGIVRIRLTLNRSGSVVKIELTEASPYKRLNDAAMRAATKASPFKPFPDEIKFETWKISLPVRFTLAQN